MVLPVLPVTAMATVAVADGNLWLRRDWGAAGADQRRGWQNAGVEEQGVAPISAATAG